MKHEALIERLATTCLGLDAVDPLRLLVDDVIAALREPEQEPVAWRDVIAVNLVREGINKHRARELAEHFIKLTTPPQRTNDIHTCTPPQEKT